MGGVEESAGPVVPSFNTATSENEVERVMANPKRRHSKARRDRRRAHDSLDRPATSLCPNCGEVKLPHRACSHCGHYKGREVFEPKESL
jgi:large subunit ribosomal protein L32